MAYKVNHMYMCMHVLRFTVASFFVHLIGFTGLITYVHKYIINPDNYTVFAYVHV